MKNIIIIILVIASWCLVIAAPAGAASDLTGTNPGNFLKLEGGARPISLGGAFVALADDINAVYYNPAGIARLKSTAISSMYNNYLADISHANLGFVFSDIKGGMSTGLLVDYVGAGPMDETTAAHPLGTGNSFSPMFVALTAPFAFQPLPPLSCGLNLKVLMDKISTAEALGYGVDLGLLWDITDNISVGLCARNLAGALMDISSATLLQTNTALASNYALGLCYRLPFLNLALDYNQPSDNQGTINLGAEYNLSNIFFARLGFSTRSEESAGGNLGAGLGLKLGVFDLDYAYSPYADLGTTHRISVSLVFPGGPETPMTAEVQRAVTSEAKPVKPVIVLPATPEAQVTSEAKPIPESSPAAISVPVQGMKLAPTESPGTLKIMTTPKPAPKKVSKPVKKKKAKKPKSP